MYLMMTYIMMILLIPIIVLLINLFKMKLNFKMREKNMPFECGFPPLSNLRLPFSIQFFFITIIFLIFGVEMTLLFPMIKSLNFVNLTLWLTSSLIMFILLIMGLFI